MVVVCRLWLWSVSMWVVRFTYHGLMSLVHLNYPLYMPPSRRSTDTKTTDDDGTRSIFELEMNNSHTLCVCFICVVVMSFNSVCYWRFFWSSNRAFWYSIHTFLMCAVCFFFASTEMLYWIHKRALLYIHIFVMSARDVAAYMRWCGAYVHWAIIINSSSWHDHRHHHRRRGRRRCRCRWKINCIIFHIVLCNAFFSLLFFIRS